jgi:hypothetical protein
MSESKTNRKSRRATELPMTVPSKEIIRGIELLKLPLNPPFEYSNPQDFAKRFTRCTRTKFTQVTYSGRSN